MIVIIINFDIIIVYLEMTSNKIKTQNINLECAKTFEIEIYSFHQGNELS